MAMEALTAMRNMNEFSYDRKMADAGFPNGLPIICQDIPFDVDMLRIVGLPVRFLPNLCYGICDLAGRQPLIKEFQKRNIDTGCCIISSPILVYIPHERKADFSTEFQHSVNDRFLSISTVRNGRVMLRWEEVMQTKNKQTCLFFVDFVSLEQ